MNEFTFEKKLIQIETKQKKGKNYEETCLLNGKCCANDEFGVLKTRDNSLACRARWSFP